METLDLLRVILARDATAPPAERWDARDWDAVHEAVIAWDAAPLAASAMRAAGLAKLVPKPIFEAWRRDHTGTTAVNMRLASEATSIVRAIEALGGRAATLKGTALFELGIYRDPGARPTSDIDLIVAPDSTDAVHAVMRARGYAQWDAGGVKHWPPFQRDGLLVEIHEHAFWSLADGHRVGLPEMLDLRRRPSIAMLVAHLLHHLFESSVTAPWLVVKTLADLAEVRAFAIARPDGDEVAGAIARAAARLGLGERLATLSGLLARALDREVPATWLRAGEMSPDAERSRRAPGAWLRAGEMSPDAERSRRAPGGWLRGARGFVLGADGSRGDEAPHGEKKEGSIQADGIDQGSGGGVTRSDTGGEDTYAKDLDRKVEGLLRRAAPRPLDAQTALRLPDKIAGLARMPLAETAARIRHYLVPPVDAMRRFYGLPQGSPWVWPLYPLRPIQLLGRSGLDAARLLIEGRRGRGRRS